MLTLRRFEALVGSYGADLRRWPAEMRADAQKLLDFSAPARALLAEARTLDEAIERASRREDAALWHHYERDATLARLRSRVAARIAPAVSRRRPARWSLAQILFGSAERAPWARTGTFGMAAGSGIAVAAGFLIGAWSVPAPTSNDVLAVLQPAPIHIFAD